MAKAYDRAATRDYIPTCDRGLAPAEQTTFKLGGLSVFDYTAMEEATSKANGAAAAIGTLETVRRALRGWVNFKLANGEDIPFVKGEDGVCTRDTLTFIGARELIELAKDCAEHERLTPDEVGKS